MKFMMARVLCLLTASLLFHYASASLSIVLGWDPSPDSEVIGYRLHIGESTDSYSRVIDVGPATQAVASELEWDTLYYFAVTAYDAELRESEPSEPIAYRTPKEPVVTIDPPEIHEQPTAQLVVKGEDTTLDASWSGGSPLICQWYKDNVPLNAGEDSHYSGVNSSKLKIINADESCEGVYSVILSNPSGSTRSTPAYVHVLNEPRVENVVALDDGTTRITVANQDGSPLTSAQVMRVTVLASTNPAPDSAWIPLTNGMILSEGALKVKDVHVLNYPQRYYRALVSGSSIGPLHVEHPQRLEDGLRRIWVKRADELRSLTPAEAGSIRVQVSFDPFGLNGWQTLEFPLRHATDRLFVDDLDAPLHARRFYRSVTLHQNGARLRLRAPALIQADNLEVTVTRADGLPLENEDVFNYQVFVKTNLLGSSYWTLLTHPMSYSDGVLTVDDTNAAAANFGIYRVFAR